MDGERSSPDECTVERWVARGPLSRDGFMAEPLPVGGCTVQGGGRPVLSDKSLKFVHQLDYATSGVLCLAFSRDMAASVAHCFEFRHTRKEYSALLHGWVPDDVLTLKRAGSPAAAAAADVPSGAAQSTAAATVTCGGRHLRKDVDLAAAVLPGALGAAVLDWPIGKDPSDPEGFRMMATVRAATKDGAAAAEGDGTTGGAAPEGQAKGLAAMTVMNVLARGTVELPVLDPSGEATGGTRRVPCTHVRLRLFTGRRHQLRVHCAALGFPIVGDSCYCATYSRPTTGKSSSDAAAPPVHLSAPRMMLHALNLRIGLDIAAHTALGASDRNRAKKLRRRETNGFDPIMDDDTLPHTDFASTDRLLEHFTPRTPAAGEEER
jgi:hypothetical protein